MLRCVMWSCVHGDNIVECTDQSCRPLYRKWSLPLVQDNQLLCIVTSLYQIHLCCHNLYFSLSPCHRWLLFSKQCPLVMIRWLQDIFLHKPNIYGSIESLIHLSSLSLSLRQWWMREMSWIGPGWFTFFSLIGWKYSSPH